MVKRLGGDLFEEEHRPGKRGVDSPQDPRILIVFVAVKIKEILIRGRGYPWPKPELCPRCRIAGVWGHGFALAYFDGICEGLWLRRYRCPECGCVMRLRPEGYLSPILGLYWVYPLEVIPPIGERALASLSIPIPARTLDEGLEEEGGSLPGEELERGPDECL